ncbi:MAG: hypothetical protein J0H99_14950 [Rhodospirillales bacterium]|nr:hypothetical protein [Rhodospirillales bacterium]
MASLVALVACPFDGVLAGMVGAGLGIEAICLYLGLSRAALDASLIRLGLRTPHDRPLRKPGARGWSVLDTMRLIAWRVAGIHPATIGERLGRSPNAVRAKARRLGIAAPDRKALRRADPATLVDPTSGFGFPDASPANATAAESALCGTAAGSVSFRTESGDAGNVVLRAPFPPGDVPVSVAVRRGKTARKPTAQGELQLLRIIPGGEPTPPPPALTWTPATDLVAPTAPIPAPAPPPATRGEPASRAKPELAWIAQGYFGRQNYRQTALEVGISESALASFYDRIDLPRDLDRRKFGDTCDQALAKVNLAKSGYEMAVCSRSQRFFCRHRSDRASVRCNRETRRAEGKISEYEKYQSARICL